MGLKIRYIMEMHKILKSFMSIELNKLNTKINNKINYRENKKIKIANGEVINKAGRPWKNKIKIATDFNDNTIMNASDAIYETVTEYNYDYIAEYNTNTIEIF